MYQTSSSKGQELVAQRMVQDFNSQGHVAYLITSVFHDGKEVVSAESLRKKKGFILVKDYELGIPVIRVDSYIVKWPRRRINFRDCIQVMGKIVDEFNLNVLITHSTLWNGPEEVAKFVSWRRKMRDLGGYKDPIVFCHMSHYQEPTEKRYSLSERTFRMAWNNLSLSQILKTANIVIVVTPLEKVAKVKMGCDPRKCFLFPGGVQEEPFIQFAAADPEDLLKRHNLPEKKKFVSYLGSLEPRKNPMNVLEVAKILKHRQDIHFLIAGKGDSEYANKIKEQASRLPNVTYLGEINTKEKIQLIKSSFVNVIMSRLEALGLAQLEFMYYGVPVVTSGVGGQAWLIRNNKEGLHAKGPDDTSGAAEAITNLADHRDIWNKLSRNAKERARSMTTAGIMEELDNAITKEMIKERDLALIPAQARNTMEQPERVLKSWSLGSWRVIVTDQRLFIKEGRLSRKIAEIPHANIAYVEHSRRYSWKPLLIGFLPAIFVLLEPLWRLILKETFVSVIESLYGLITQSISAVMSPQILQNLLVIIPALIGFALFILNSRAGFNIYVKGAKPVYLPHKLGEVISFRRGLQVRTRKTENPEKPYWEFPENGLSLDEEGRQ
jgi:D-inositol-3-phosphate glycosyltransferase